MSKRKIRDTSNLSPEQASLKRQEEINRGPTGLYGHFLFEPIPDYAKAGSEVVVQGNNNSFIVLGRDRAGTPADGMGGIGATGCGMIDLIVGMDSADAQKTFIPPDAKDPEAFIENLEDARDAQGRYFASPNFVNDAARLYLTQFGDIDYYFGIAKGSENEIAASKFKSGAGLKADHVRIVARRHLKLVVGKAKLRNAGMTGEKNSQGGTSDYPGKIDFIAGNYTVPEEPSIIGAALGKVLKAAGLQPIPKKLQPLVKGDNLELLFKELFETILDISNRVTSNSRNIDSLATAHQTHMHVASGFGVPTTSPSDPYSIFKSMKTRISGLANESMTKIVKHNLKIIQTNYFELDSAWAIKSRFVNTT